MKSRITGGNAYRAWVWVVAIDRVPFFSLENSWAICLMLSTLRRISPAVVMMRSRPG